MTELLVALLLSQVQPGSVRILDEGAGKGRAVELNCVGAGIACTVAGQRATLTVSGGGGGGGSGLPSDPSACPAGQYVTDQDINGALTCSTPPGVPAGADTYVQYRNGTAFGGTAGLTFTAATNTLGSGPLVITADTTGKLLSFNNSGAEKGYLDKDGFAHFYAYRPYYLDTLYLQGRITNAPNAVGTVIDALNTLADSGTKILSLRNGGAEMSSFDANGVFSGNILGNAATSTAFDHLPTACAANNFATAQAANGAFTCSVPPGTYTLPTASAATLGGIKVGTGLSIDGAGVLSSTGGYTLPAATSIIRGGITVGARLTITGDVLSADVQAGTYSLPVATTTVLGGVKQGSNVTIDGTGVLSVAAPYTLPDATASVTGGIKLTGDLGGTATSPTVPGLAGKEPTITTLSQAKGGTGSGALTCAAGQHLTSNGTVYSCTADSGGSLAAATATVLGGLKGNGTTTACSGSDKMTGWDAAGAMTCAADATGGAGSANAISVSVTLSAPVGVYTTTVTGQAWVGASSNIVCQPQATSADGQTVETYYVTMLQPTVSTLVAGTGFTLAVYNHRGASGVFRFACTGV